jgi:hypothetical protein
MGERGTSSQVSVDFESHRRLEVEEARECSSWEEKGEVESKGSVPPREDHCSPFYQTKRASYINAMRQTRRERGSVHAQQVYGGSHASGPVNECP